MVRAAQGRSYRWHASVNHDLGARTQWLLCWVVRNASMVRLGPAPSHRPSRLPLGAACRPGGRRRRPPEARPKLLSHDLDHRPGAAVLSGPAPLLEPAHGTTRLPFDSDCAAWSAWSRHTTTVKNDASCSRGPLTVTRNMALD